MHKTITEKIKSISESKKDIVSSNEKRVNEIADSVADIKLALEKLEWKPKVSFEEGITEIIKSLKNKMK